MGFTPGSKKKYRADPEKSATNTGTFKKSIASITIEDSSNRFIQRRPLF
jgi:hypothetical protein